MGQSGALRAQPSLPHRNVTEGGSRQSTAAAICASRHVHPTFCVATTELAVVDLISDIARDLAASTPRQACSSRPENALLSITELAAMAPHLRSYTRSGLHAAMIAGRLIGCRIGARIFSNPRRSAEKMERGSDA